MSDDDEDVLLLAPKVAAELSLASVGFDCFQRCFGAV